MRLCWEITLAVAVLAAVTVGSSTTEGDFAFETDEITPRSNNDECSVRRLWGVPNMPAYVGRMFHFRIPKEAFTGKVAEFKVTGTGNSLPKWLAVDSKHGVLRGVPTSEEIGEHRLKVKAYSTKMRSCPPAVDTFSIEVKESSEFSESSEEMQCHSGEEETILVLYVNEVFSMISPKERIIAIDRLANFMGLNQSKFLIQPHEAKSKHPVKVSKHPTEIQLLVGCSGKLWPKHSLLVHQIHEQVKHGSISFITQLPVNAWKLINRKLEVSPVRKQRDTDQQDFEGSAYEDDEYDDAGNDDEDFYSGNYDYDAVPSGAPSPTTLPSPTPSTEPPHHHRHHHGETHTVTSEETINREENFIDNEESTTHKRSTIGISSTSTETTPPDPPSYPVFPEESSSSVYSSPTYTTLYTTDTPTTVASTSTQDNIVEDPSPSPEPEVPSPPPSPSPSPEIPIIESVSPVTFATHTTLPVEDTTIFATDDIVTQIPESTTKPANKVEEVISSSTVTDLGGSPSTSEEPIPTDRQSTPVDTKIIFTSTDVPDTDDEISTFDTKDTSTYEGTTTEHPSTVIGQTTEIVRFTPAANSPPQKQHRTKKVAVTAGKYFSYIIPEDLFIDIEDGTDLLLNMYDTDHAPLKSTSWVQFNPRTREVYGLPLEEHVSKWEYIVEATDSKGLSVTDTLDITVQQHKGRRTVNHEFSMKLRIQDKFNASIDWQIKILKGLVSLFRDTDMDQITVRDVNTESDPIEFIWTNDTLPKNYCPQSDITRLMGILQANPDGEPSAALVSTLSPDLRVKSVTWKGTGPCQAPAPTPPVPAPPVSSDNYSPVPRNQIDHINATVGKLLIFKVPEDTFYDPEDGGAPNLKMWLMRGNGAALSPTNWLQFDNKNQEFFGLPAERDVGRADYQLVCEDSGGLTGKDILLVEVHPAPPIKPTVEFSMTLDTRSDNFINTALLKRKFIDKLQQLFNDKDTSNIRIKSITDRPTVINWYNTSLPTEKCPENDIKKLRKVLVREDETLTERLDVIMGSDFPVMSVTLNRKGVCAVAGPPIISVIPPKPARPVDETSKTAASSDDYLITFIVPIAVIVCMLFVAALIACILYKRRRTGKMNVGDEEERQAFQSNGIPIIFQDELDEKPDSTNKSPVIMKEEKPPLLPPPEYKGMEGSSPTPSHTPYHPPPPFTASRDTPRNNRPKPSPAYRKPPPYVPP